MDFVWIFGIFAIHVNKSSLETSGSSEIMTFDSSLKALYQEGAGGLADNVLLHCNVCRVAHGARKQRNLMEQRMIKNCHGGVLSVSFMVDYLSGKMPSMSTMQLLSTR